MTNIGILGANGHVGKLLVSKGGIPLVCNLLDKNTVESEMKRVAPDILVLAAGYSGVDWCQAKVNQTDVIETNYMGSYHVFRIAEELHIQVVFLSSDHVFDGMYGSYREDDRPNPVNYYGLVKTSTEAIAKTFDNVKVVRTSTLFDIFTPSLQEYLAPLENNKEILVPNFIIRSFMYLPHFADSFWYYLNNIDKMPQILHISGNHCVSWFSFINSMAKVLDLNEKLVLPRNYELENIGAPRPKKAGLDVSESYRLQVPQYTELAGLWDMKVDELEN
jgi:dTDP-4-dehydrorhamnose reductase